MANPHAHKCPECQRAIACICDTGNGVWEDRLCLWCHAQGAELPATRYFYGEPEQEEIWAYTVNQAVEIALDGYALPNLVPLPVTIVIARFEPMELEWGSYSPLAFALEMLEGEDMRDEPFEPTEKMREAEKGFMAVVLAEYRVRAMDEVPGERVEVNVEEWIRENKPEWRL